MAGTGWTYYIYALVDPYTDEVRYIGRTQNPKKRLSNHLTSKRMSLVKEWIDTLDLPPKMVILYKVNHYEDAAGWERSYIAKYALKGASLLNIYR